jgi:hypothetical protein
VGSSTLALCNKYRINQNCHKSYTDDVFLFKKRQKTSQRACSCFRGYVLIAHVCMYACMYVRMYIIPGCWCAHVSVAKNVVVFPCTKTLCLQNYARICMSLLPPYLSTHHYSHMSPILSLVKREFFF